MSEPSFKFIAEMVQKILAYLDPPNKMLQSEDMDLLTGEKIYLFLMQTVQKLYLLLSKVTVYLQ